MKIPIPINVETHCNASLRRMTCLIFIFALIIGLTESVIISAAESQTEDFTYDSKGKRDPFTPPGTSIGGEGDLKLEGIISDAKGISAIISGQVVKAGDKVFGADVIDITKEAVVLQKDKKKIELKLPKIGNTTQ